MVTIPSAMNNGMQSRKQLQLLKWLRLLGIRQTMVVVTHGSKLFSLSPNGSRRPTANPETASDQGGCVLSKRLTQCSSGGSLFARSKFEAAGIRWEATELGPEQWRELVAGIALVGNGIRRERMVA